MGYFLEQTGNALSLGGIYALLAIGLAVVYSILGLINFAHGAFLTVGGYMSSSRAASAGCSPCSATTPLLSGSAS